MSPATSGIIATLVDSEQPSATTYQGFTLTPGAKASASSPAACSAADSNGAYTCSLYFAVSAANSPYSATLTAYDAGQSGTSEKPVAAAGKTSAVALSTDTETLTIAANQSNSFAFTLHGIVEAFESDPQYIGIAASPAPGASPLASTFHALDGDSYLIDAVDAATTFYAGSQSSGTFAAASFPVTAVDENACSKAPCVSLASPSPVIADPASETISFSYNGGAGPGDGTVNNPPYYGLIGVTGPSDYDGNVSATVGKTQYAATAYVVPFFGIVDTSGSNAAATDASDVSFTTSSQSVNLLALQYHLPTNSTAGYTASSTCGSIATVSAGTPLSSGYGASFTLTAGTQSGTCTATLSDGAGDTSAINVSNSPTAAPQVAFGPVPSPDTETCQDGRECDTENGSNVLTVTYGSTGDKFYPACGNDSPGFGCSDAYQANGGYVYCNYEQPGYESASIKVSSADGSTNPGNAFDIQITPNNTSFECTFSFNDLTSNVSGTYEFDVNPSGSASIKRKSGATLHFIRSAAPR